MCNINYPCNLSACFGVGLCWDLHLDMLQAIKYITSEYNVRKQEKKLFSTVLSWFDLAVTLRSPLHYLGIISLWYQTPTDVTMCTWVGFRTIYSKFWSNNLLSTILSWFDLAVTFRCPYHDLGISPYDTQHLPMSPCVLGLGFDLFILIPP